MRFASAQILISNFVGPYLTDIIASIMAIVALIILFRIWKPREIADAAEMDGQQREGNGRAGEGLGRHNGDLGTGVQIDAAAAFARDRAADDVDDAEHPPALALDFLHGRQGVEGLARLADGDIERVALDDGIAVAKLRRGLGVRGNARERLDQMRTDRAGKIRRAASQDLLRAKWANASSRRAPWRRRGKRRAPAPRQTGKIKRLT